MDCLVADFVRSQSAPTARERNSHEIRYAVSGGGRAGPVAILASTGFTLPESARVFHV